MTAISDTSFIHPEPPIRGGAEDVLIESFLKGKVSLKNIIEEVRVKNVTFTNNIVRLLCEKLDLEELRDEHILKLAQLGYALCRILGKNKSDELFEKFHQLLLEKKQDFLTEADTEIAVLVLSSDTEAALFQRVLPKKLEGSRSFFSQKKITASSKERSNGILKRLFSKFIGQKESSKITQNIEQKKREVEVANVISRMCTESSTIQDIQWSEEFLEALIQNPKDILSAINIASEYGKGAENFVLAQRVLRRLVSLLLVRIEKSPTEELLNEASVSLNLIRMKYTFPEQKLWDLKLEAIQYLSKKVLEGEFDYRVYYLEKLSLYAANELDITLLDSLCARVLQKEDPVPNAVIEARARINLTKKSSESINKFIRSLYTLVPGMRFKISPEGLQAVKRGRIGFLAKEGGFLSWMSVTSGDKKAVSKMLDEMENIVKQGTLDQKIELLYGLKYVKENKWFLSVLNNNKKLKDRFNNVFGVTSVLQLLKEMQLSSSAPQNEIPGKEDFFKFLEKVFPSLKEAIFPKLKEFFPSVDFSACFGK